MPLIRGFFCVFERREDFRDILSEDAINLFLKRLGKYMMNLRMRVNEADFDYISLDNQYTEAYIRDIMKGKDFLLVIAGSNMEEDPLADPFGNKWDGHTRLQGLKEHGKIYIRIKPSEILTAMNPDRRIGATASIELFQKIVRPILQAVQVDHPYINQ